MNARCGQLPDYFKQKQYMLVIIFHYQGSQKYADDDEDNMVGVEDEEEGLDTNSAKVMHIRVSSLRTDTVLRSTFQIARK